MKGIEKITWFMQYTEYITLSIALTLLLQPFFRLSGVCAVKTNTKSPKLGMMC